MVFTLLASGCSSVSKSDMKDFFRTEIRDDDSKMFTFTVVVAGQNKDGKQAGKPNNQGRSGRGPSDKGGPNGSPQKSPNANRNNNRNEMTELFEELLTERLEKNQYCRQGYIDLGRSFSGSMFTLRGECHESATAKDRKHFYRLNTTKQQ